MRLILLRHAKSDWDTGTLSDHARPLSARGRADAPRVGAALRARGWIPTGVVCSDAVRARETWTHMGPILAPDVPVRFTPDLYHAGLDAILAEVTRAAAEGIAVLLLVGHNPGWEEAIPALSGEPTRLTTSNAALLERRSGGSWRRVDVLRPREL